MSIIFFSGYLLFSKIVLNNNKKGDKKDGKISLYSGCLDESLWHHNVNIKI